MSTDTNPPSIPVKTAPGVEDKVRAFLQEKGATVAAEATKPAPERIKAPEDTLFSEPNPEEEAVASALIDIRSVSITDEEKDLFLKALLCDKPVELDIVLFAGKLKLTFRSRSMHEQRRVLDVLHLDQEEQLLPGNDPALLFTRLQQYLTAVMLRRINSEVFSELELPPGKEVVADASALRKVFADKLEQMPHIRWTAILNGLRIFEEKCRQLSEHCVNEDFWSPRG